MAGGGVYIESLVEGDWIVIPYSVESLGVSSTSESSTPKSYPPKEYPEICREGSLEAESIIAEGGPEKGSSRGDILT